MISITPAQARLLRFICDYQADHGGVSPSFGEMMAGIGAKGVRGVFDKLTALEERGHIRRAYGRARAIEVLAAPPCDRIGKATCRVGVFDFHPVVPA